MSGVAPDLRPRCAVDVGDPPFAVPPDVVLDLPVPPSANRLWRYDRGRKPHPSDAYKRWQQQAGMALMVDGKLRARRMIDGQFEAIVVVDRQATGCDLDNVGTKAVFDLCQKHNFVLNDKLCGRYSVEWASPDRAPRGMRVILRPMEAAA